MDTATTRTSLSRVLSSATASEAHCAQVHSKSRKDARDAKWDQFFNADEARKQEMVREFLLKQRAAGIKNSLCP